MWDSQVRYYNFCLRKIYSIGWPGMKRSLKRGKHLQWREIMGGLYLSMTRVLRLWSVGPSPTCTANCYCLIYCNPFVMSWSGARLFIPWLTCSIRSGGAKESCNCSLWMSLCLYDCSSTTFPYVSWVLAWKVLGTVGPHIPLPSVVGQSLV